MNKIEFDNRTKENIKELNRSIAELQARLQLILQTVINMKAEDPEKAYRLAPDMSGLVEVEDDEEKE